VKAEHRRHLMTRGLTVASAFVMAGMVTIAAVQDAGAFQGDASPFQVRVTDAQRKGVPKIAVEVMPPDQPRRSFATDQDGRVAIPAGVVRPGRRGAEPRATGSR
jgi:hypothetical protein